MKDDSLKYLGCEGGGGHGRQGVTKGVRVVGECLCQEWLG